MNDRTVTPDSDDTRAFRDALGRYATGVAVITIATQDGPMGFTANSFASVSLDPPLVLWSPAKSSMRYPFFVAAKQFAIHVLGAEQDDLSRRFVRGGRGFDGLAPELTAEGVPVIAGTLARFDCVQHATYPGGDHLIVVGRVIRATTRNGTPLVFSQGAYGRFDPGL
jgi:flavin reductase (DIM6/NTAB) family NADH-FMN oxidoreductase RutF